MARIESGAGSVGLPASAVTLLESAEHSAGWALFADSRLALAVARGTGRTVDLLGALAREAGNAVSLHGTGGAWMIADEPPIPRVERAVYPRLTEDLQYAERPLSPDPEAD
jgi:hypothetical protein